MGVALGGCAALVAVGYACGSWQAAKVQHVNENAFLNKATAAQFGIVFSAATVGKTWSEIQKITASTKAGEGTLGAAYAALSPSDKKAFHLSADKSYSSGATGATVVSPASAVVPAKTPSSATTAASST